jgi:hypothetical protein
LNGGKGVGHGGEVEADLGSCIYISSSDKLNNMMAVLRSKLRRTASKVFFEGRMHLRLHFPHSRLPNTQFSSNFANRITILQHKDDV